MFNSLYRKLPKTLKSTSIFSRYFYLKFDLLHICCTYPTPKYIIVTGHIVDLWYFVRSIQKTRIGLFRSLVLSKRSHTIWQNRLDDLLNVHSTFLSHYLSIAFSHGNRIHHRICSFRRKCQLSLCILSWFHSPCAPKWPKVSSISLNWLFPKSNW